MHDLVWQVFKELFSSLCISTKSNHLIVTLIAIGLVGFKGWVLVSVFFSGEEGERGGAKRPFLSKTCHTLPTTMKIGTVIP